MRNKIVILMLWVLLFCGGLAQADGITFTSNGTIDDPQVWDYVNVRNDGTVLQILGGTVGGLNIYDTAHVEMHGGTINNPIFARTGSFFMDGGVLNGSIVGGAMIDINGGVLNVPGSYIKSPDAIVNIRGGVTPLGGNWGIYIEGYGGALNIYGYGFVWDSTESLLSGYLADNNPFAFRIGTYEKTTLHVVPEPVSLCLLAFGGLILRRNCKK
jgi:hypothetical protein